jgi:anti-sigma regulatory factor (Ser/Thr protein kinase)
MSWPVADSSAAPRCARCGRRHGYESCGAAPYASAGHTSGQHPINPQPTSAHVTGPQVAAHWTGQLSGWSSGVSHPGQQPVQRGDRRRITTGEHPPASPASPTTTGATGVLDPGAGPAGGVLDTTYGVGGTPAWGETSGWGDTGNHQVPVNPLVTTGPLAPAAPLDDRGQPWPERREPAWPSVTTNPFGNDALSASRRAERRERSRTASFGFPLQTHTPRRARRHTVEFAQHWGLDDLIEAAELLVSELMTNALEASYLSLGRHGASRVVAPLELRLSAEDGHKLRIEVRDHNPQPPVLDEPGLHSERGRGLMLVDCYAEFWGYHRLPTGGKVVWCVIGSPADNA